MSEELADWERELLGLNVETKVETDFIIMNDNVSHIAYCDWQTSHGDRCDKVIPEKQGYWIGSNSCCGYDDYYICHDCYERDGWKRDSLTIYPREGITYADWVEFKTWVKQKGGDNYGIN